MRPARSGNYSPDAPFTAGNAMGRNKLIYAQSAVTVVVASDADRGGTRSGAVEALKGGIGRVSVWRGPGEGPGNEAIEQRGAVSLRAVDELGALLASDEPTTVSQSPGPQQPSPFDTQARTDETAPAMTRFVVLWVIPVVAVAFVLRVIGVALLERRAPRVARAIADYWAWLPLLVVIVALAFVHPLIGVAAAVASFVFLRSAAAIGSPFRPRR